MGSQALLEKKGVTSSATRTPNPDGRLGTIRARLQADSLETVATIASEALETWSRSGTDPTVRRGVELIWTTPGGGTETGFVGAVADR